MEYVISYLLHHTMAVLTATNNFKIKLFLIFGQSCQISEPKQTSPGSYLNGSPQGNIMVAMQRQARLIISYLDHRTMTNLMPFSTTICWLGSFSDHKSEIYNLAPKTL